MSLRLVSSDAEFHAGGRMTYETDTPARQIDFGEMQAGRARIVDGDWSFDSDADHLQIGHVLNCILGAFSAPAAELRAS